MSSRPKVIERNEMFFKEHFSCLSQTRTTRNDNSNASGIFWDLVAPKTRSLLTLCYAYTCKLSGITKASSLWGHVGSCMREQWHVSSPNTALPNQITLRRSDGGDTLLYTSVSWLPIQRLYQFICSKQWGGDAKHSGGILPTQQPRVWIPLNYLVGGQYWDWTHLALGDGFHKCS